MQNQTIQTPTLPFVLISQEALSQGVDALERLGFFVSMAKDLADAMSFIVANTADRAEQIKVL